MKWRNAEKLGQHPLRSWEWSGEGDAQGAFFEPCSFSDGTQICAATLDFRLDCEPIPDGAWMVVAWTFCWLASASLFCNRLIHAGERTQSGIRGQLRSGI